MAFIELVPAERAGDAADLFEADTTLRGYLPNYTRAFAHRADVYRAWRGLIGAIAGNMDTRRYELATFAAARRLRSSYCALAHGAVLAERHVGADAIPDLVSGTAPLEPVDTAVMRLADTVAAGAADMTEEDLRQLRDLGLADAEILDVVLAAAARCFFSSVLDAVGAEPDAAYQALAAPAREALTVGRRIEPGG
jgi:uncharacterized peroxidase-related enzyme